MDDPNLEIDFSSIESKDQVSQEEKEAKFLKILLTFELGLKNLTKFVPKGRNINTSGPEAQLLLLISLPTWIPTPLTLGCLFRCIKLLYGIANITNLHRFLDKLLDWFNVKEAIPEAKKSAILECIRSVVEAQGSKLYNYILTIVTLCLKFIKNSSESTNIRYNAMLLLKSILKVSGSSIDDPTMKEVIRVCKNLLTNRSSSFVVIGAECLESVYLYCPTIPSVYLSEELPGLVKVFDGANFSTRRAVASLISILVAGSQASNQKIMVSKPKKQLVGKAGGKGKLAEDKDQPSGIPTIGNMLNSLALLHGQSNTSEEVRAGIFQCYIALLTKLGTSFVESNYGEVLRHVVLDLNPGPNYTPESPFDALVVRQRSNTLLREVGQKILSEQGQVHAAKSILDMVGEWIKIQANPDLKTRAAGKGAIIAAIDELSCLIQDLGDAAYAIQDTASELLMVLLETQSYSIQISASWALRNLCIALPSMLPKLVSKFVRFLRSNVVDVMPIKKSDLKKAMGYGYSIGALTSVSASAPQSVMYQLNSSIFSIACMMLKAESNVSFTVADVNIFQSQNTKIQVGWVLLGALMSLGPNYVRMVLPQVIMLFKAYLSKSSTKLSFFDSASQMLTLSVAHSREHALQALLLFLTYSGDELVSGDIAQRILPLLTNSLQFFKDTNLFILSLSEKEREASITNLRKLSESVNMIRKRALQCYAAISTPISFESSFGSISKSVVELLTVTSKTDRATTTWTDEDVVADWTGWANSGYAMTSHFHRRNLAIDRWRADRDAYQDENNHLFEALAHVDQFDLDRQLLYPRFGAREFDPISLYLSHAYTSKRPNYFHSLTSTVTSTHDAAVDLFAILFPHLLPRAQFGLMERMIHAAKDKSDGWNLYTLSHCLFAVMGALKSAFSSGAKQVPAQAIFSEKVIGQFDEVIKVGLKSVDDHIRKLSAEVLGFLCKHAGSGFLSKQITKMVDDIVTYADPDIRAGCLAGLSNIYRFCGSLTGGSHLPSVIQVMRTLCNDMHPLVHTQALEALATTINSVGHAFSPFIVDTLYIVLRLFLSDSHQPGGHAYAKNILVDHFLIRQSSGKVLAGIIGVLGPEIAVSRAPQFLCYGMMEHLKYDEEDMVVVEYLQCVHLVIMFDYAHIDLEFLVTFLCSRIQSVDPQLKRVAANCLYQLVQKNVADVLKFAGPNLFEQLFQLLDSESELGEIVVVLNMLLSNSTTEELPQWIGVIQTILSKHNVDQIGSNQDDDEDGTLTARANPSIRGSKHQVSSRWRTQLVALQILRKVIAKVQQSSTTQLPHPYLVNRFGDLVKLAFAAATTPIENISLEGYGILQDLLQQFKDAEDPQMPGILLLDQYQAQIAAALAPALNGEFSPKVTASAVEVCATFLTTGTGNAKTMARLTKLMEGALGHCLSGQGREEAESTSSYGSAIVSLAVLRGWSTIALTGTQEGELSSILDRHLGQLCQLWINALTDYAYIQLDPKLVSLTDQGDGVGTIRLASGLGTVSHASARNWLKPIYREHWISFLLVVTLYMERDEVLVLRHFNPSHPTPATTPNKNFWVLLGLCMETLSSHSLTSHPGSVLLAKSCLGAIKSLFRPSLTGPTFLNYAVLSDILVVLDRFKYTHSLHVVHELVSVLDRMIDGYHSDLFFTNPVDGEVEESAMATFTNSIAHRMTKLLTGILLGFVPSLVNDAQPIQRQLSSKPIDLSVITLTCQALTSLTLKSPPSLHSDLCTVTYQLIHATSLQPQFHQLSSILSGLADKLIGGIENNEVATFEGKKLISLFFENRKATDPSNIALAGIYLIRYVSFVTIKPDQAHQQSEKWLSAAIWMAIDTNQLELQMQGLASLLVLIDHIESENTKLSTISKTTVAHVLPRLINDLGRLAEGLVELKDRIKLVDSVTEVLTKLIELNPKHELALAHQLLSSLIQLLPLPYLSLHLCATLTQFGSSHPNQFKAAFKSLTPEMRQSLEAALKSNPRSSNISAEVNKVDEDDEFGDFDDEGEDGEDDDGFGSFDEDDDGFGDFDEAEAEPTIQLKSSFF